LQQAGNKNPLFTDAKQGIVFHRQYDGGSVMSLIKISKAGRIAACAKQYDNINNQGGKWFCRDVWAIAIL
jgi:hypothetical protein